MARIQELRGDLNQFERTSKGIKAISTHADDNTDNTDDFLKCPVYASISLGGCHAYKATDQGDTREHV